MKFAAIKCSECGAKIEIDENKESGFCPNCGTKFLREKKEIKNVINYNKITNIDKQININQEEKIDETKLEKTLFSLMSNFNFDKAEKLALDILKKIPDNPLANLVIEANFGVKTIFNNTLSFISFNYPAVINYFSQYSGNINLDISSFFIYLALKSEDILNEYDELIFEILSNVNNLNLKKNELINFYKKINFFIIENELNVKILREESKKLKKAAWTNILLTQVASVSATADYEAKNISNIATTIEDITNICKSTISCFINEESDYKNDLNDIINFNTQDSNYNSQSSKNFSVNNEHTKISKNSIIGVIIFIAIIILLIGLGLTK